MYCDLTLTTSSPGNLDKIEIVSFFVGYFSGDFVHTLCFLALLQPWTRDGERHRQAPPTTGRVSGIPKHTNKKAFFSFSIVHAMHNRNI